MQLTNGSQADFHQQCQNSIHLVPERTPGVTGKPRCSAGALSMASARALGRATACRANHAGTPNHVSKLESAGIRIHLLQRFANHGSALQ